ncbi:hypothetical protein [Roseomonas sp. WA12]
MVDNRPGAGGSPGTGQTGRSLAGGYMLLAGSNGTTYSTRF